MILCLAYAILLLRIASKENRLSLLAGISALVGFLYAFIAMFAFAPIKVPELWESTRLLAGLVSIPSFYYLWNKASKTDLLTEENKKIVAGICFAAASILTIMLISMEIQASAFEATVKSLIISISWVLMAVTYIGIGFKSKIKISRLTGISFFGLAILKVFFLDLATLDILYRIISFFVLGVILLLAAFLYKRYEKQLV